METKKEVCEMCGTPVEVPTGAALREIREQVGLTLQALGQKIGFTVSYLSDIERERRRATPAIVRAYEELPGQTAERRWGVSEKRAIAVRYDKRIEIVRTCLACKHFDVDLGEPAWSDLTPGSNPEVLCLSPKGADFEFGQRERFPSPEFLIQTAGDCEAFEIAEELLEEDSP
jgi:transcriptional regulator with XRE-family HTH domain